MSEPVVALEPVLVTLTTYECLFAAQVGLARQIRNKAQGHHNRNGSSELGYEWGHNIDGACAEFAVSKYLDRFWSGATGHAADVSLGVQVRQTHYSDGCMLVKREDADDDIYVGVFGTAAGPLLLAGWLTGAEAKQEQWWRAERPGGWCYFVPQEALRPMSELRQRLTREAAHA